MNVFFWINDGDDKEPIMNMLGFLNDAEQVPAANDTVEIGDVIYEVDNTEWTYVASDDVPRHQMFSEANVFLKDNTRWRDDWKRYIRKEHRQ